MAIRVCPHCQRPFSQLRNEEVCLACMAKGEDEFRRIKEYLYEHPGASATELVQRLGVTIRQIQHYLREDRLEVVGEGYTGLTCDKCGKPLKTGRMCEHCEKEVASQKRQEFKKAALRAVKEMKEENKPKKDPEKEKPKQTGLRFRNDPDSRHSGRK